MSGVSVTSPCLVICVKVSQDLLEWHSRDIQPVIGEKNIKWRLPYILSFPRGVTRSLLLSTVKIQQRGCDISVQGSPLETWCLCFVGGGEGRVPVVLYLRAGTEIPHSLHKQHYLYRQSRCSSHRYQSGNGGVPPEIQVPSPQPRAKLAGWPF